MEAVQKRPEIIQTLFLRDDIEQKNLFKNVLNVKAFTGDAVPKGVDKNATHQGYIAEIDVEALMIPFKTFRDSLEADTNTSVVILGEVQDPHNVGAIVRSAAAFGCRAVLIPEHRGCPVTGTVIKTSAGTAFSMPLVSIGNVNNAIRDLKNKGFWVYGLDGDGETNLTEEQFTKPSAFVVGNEATGMRLKTHEHCDTILTIPMHKNAESLNASVSAAVVLHTWNTQHPESLS